MCVSVQCGYLSCRIFECACVVTCEWGYYIVFISFHTKNCCYRLSWHASAIVCRYILVDMVSLPLRKWKYFVIIVNARKISNYRIVAFVNRFGIFTLSLSLPPSLFRLFTHSLARRDVCLLFLFCSHFLICTLHYYIVYAMPLSLEVCRSQVAHRCANHDSATTLLFCTRDFSSAFASLLHRIRIDHVILFYFLLLFIVMNTLIWCESAASGVCSQIMQ